MEIQQRIFEPYLTTKETGMSLAIVIALCFESLIEYFLGFSYTFFILFH